MESTHNLPTWLKALTFLYFLSNLVVFGGLALFYPQVAFPDAGAAAAFPIQFFAIRHIAFAFPLAYGLLREDINVLWATFGMFLIMSSLDVLLLFLNGYYIPVIGEVSLLVKIAFAIGGFIGPVSLAFWKLTQLKRQPTSLQHA